MRRQLPLFFKITSRRIMDDFKRKPINRAQPTPRASRPISPTPSIHTPDTPSAEPPVISVDTSPPLPPTGPQPIEPAQPTGLIKKPVNKKKRLIIWIAVIVVALLVMLGGLVIWYKVQLSPVDTKSSNKVLVTIDSGATPAAIANTLKSKSLIRDENIFLWYTRITGTQNYLQAGTYRLSPSESTPEIVDHLKNGNVDTFNITFLPGATLAQNRKVFLNAGYTAQEVDAALSATYTNSPLFDSKPASADLEGYIYGDTYKVGAGDSVQEILQTAFDEFNKVVQDNNLVAQYQSHGLSLYEGITLASIVQREAAGGDEAGIAQVFYSRLALNMPLGSDVTYQYIADKMGVARDPNIDSPYNTRKYPGLPPGPISVPGKAALLAVANPASTDYLYFLNGDDNVTYFSKTLDEHEANIKNHCQVKCQSL